ncbi:unnamed protein product [Linum trigynum]|uniref:Uncharacterized protein n=1 Tax=Linum trigynum TaxID=586398 RepID=A0AAV2CCL9_9ROSI
MASAAIVGDTSSWARALVTISPYTFSQFRYGTHTKFCVHQLTRRGEGHVAQASNGGPGLSELGRVHLPAQLTDLLSTRRKDIRTRKARTTRFLQPTSSGVDNQESLDESESSFLESRYFGRPFSRICSDVPPVAEVVPPATEVVPSAKRVKFAAGKSGKTSAGKSGETSAGKSRGKSSGKSEGKSSGKATWKSVGTAGGKSAGKVVRESAGKGVGKSARKGKSNKPHETQHRCHTSSLLSVIEFWKKDEAYYEECEKELKKAGFDGLLEIRLCGVDKSLLCAMARHYDTISWSFIFGEGENRKVLPLEDEDVARVYSLPHVVEEIVLDKCLYKTKLSAFQAEIGMGGNRVVLLQLKERHSLTGVNGDVHYLVVHLLEILKVKGVGTSITPTCSYWFKDRQIKRFDGSAGDKGQSSTQALDAPEFYMDEDQLKVLKCMTESMFNKWKARLARLETCMEPQCGQE